MPTPSRGSPWTRVLDQFWLLPFTIALTAGGLALGAYQLDRALDTSVMLPFLFSGGPEGARSLLAAIITSMISFTGLVFSITILVLQLTSSQFSPRILRTFLRDRFTQVSLGVFVATFVYAVLVLRTVRSTSDAAFVPALSTTVGVGLLLLSVGMFVAYIHHVATTIQVSSILDRIGRETRAAIDRRFPAGGGPQGDDSRPLLPDVCAVLPAPRSGALVRVDEAGLVEAAADADVVLRLRVRLGEHVPQGAPLIEVLGDGQRLDAGRALAAIRLARDRTLEQDVAFGFRQLVDIADRALSPGINDPTTAVQALDELHDLLRRLVTRRLPPAEHSDDRGALRLITPTEEFRDYLALALDEIEHYGADSLQVQQRVRGLLADLEAAARPEHRAATVERRQGGSGRRRIAG